LISFLTTNIDRSMKFTQMFTLAFDHVDIMSFVVDIGFFCSITRMWKHFVEIIGDPLNILRQRKGYAYCDR